MEKRRASPYLFYPVNGELQPRSSSIKDFLQPALLDKVYHEISHTLQQDKYPCVAAVQSYTKNQYEVGFYDSLGLGNRNYELASDLIHFVENLDLQKTPFQSFWAVFEETKSLSEEEFEKALWRELSYLTSHQELPDSWDPSFSSNPEDKNFCFSLGGHAFYVVGLHPNSSRLSRRFPFPVLLFNAYEQFNSLIKKGTFAPMVKANRKLDSLFQGSVNPMVEKYSESWESIQFSGKSNPENWKCPFQHGLRPQAKSGNL